MGEQASYRARREAAALELHFRRAQAGAQWCPAHKREKPCQPCAVFAEQTRRRWADPEWRAKRERAVRASPRSRMWLAAEDGLLRSLAGKMSAGDMVREFANRGYRRTKAAILTRAEQHGVDLFRRGRTANEVAQMFGVCADRTVRAWRQRGFLRTFAYGERELFADDVIEAFIKAEPWAYDVDRMPVGRFRQLAETVRTRDPWLKLEDAARLVPCQAETITRRIRSGELDGRQRPGFHGQILIRASSIAALRESIQASIERRQRGLHLVPNAAFRFRKAVDGQCTGCGGPIPRGRRMWCSDRCCGRIWARKYKQRQREARVAVAA